MTTQKPGRRADFLNQRLNYRLLLLTMTGMTLAAVGTPSKRPQHFYSGDPARNENPQSFQHAVPFISEVSFAYERGWVSGSPRISPVSMAVAGRNREPRFSLELVAGWDGSSAIKISTVTYALLEAGYTAKRKSSETDKSVVVPRERIEDCFSGTGRPFRSSSLPLELPYVVFLQSQALLASTVLPTSVSLAGPIIGHQKITRGNPVASTWSGGGADNNWTTGANWGGTAPVPTGSGDITFAGAVGLTPNIDTPYTISSLTFAANAGAFTLSGGALTIGAGGITQSSTSNLQTLANSGITLSAAQTWTIGAGGLTVSAPVSGSAALTLTGAGTLTLSGTNTYIGNTTVGSGGTLRIAADNNLGATSGTLALNNAALQTGSAFTLNAARNLTLTGSSAIDTQGFSPTVAGVISGSGSLTKVGAGTLILTGTNLYTGGTVVNGGTIRPSTDASLGGASGGVTLNGTTLQWGNTFTLASTRPVTFGSGGGIFDTNGYSPTVAGVISGTGALTKTGSGSLTLSNTSNTYSGGTVLSTGTLRVSSDANLGVVPSSFSAANLALGASTTLQFAGSFTMNANRGITLTGADTIDTNNNAVMISGAISGSGSLTKAGLSTLTLSGTNTYTGTTAISAGILQFTSLAAIGGSGASVTVGTNGTMSAGYAMDQSFLNRIVSGSAGVVALAANSANNLDLSSAGANLTMASLGATGAYTYSGALTPNGTAYRLGGGSGTLTVSGSLGGSSNNLVVNGNGATASTSTVVLTGTNTFGGGTSATTVNTGFLIFNSVNNIGGGGAKAKVLSTGTIGDSSAIDQTFLSLIDSASTGVVALNAASSNALDFSSASGANLANVSLGTIGNLTYSGSLTPNGTTYRLGGGNGTLTVSSLLSGVTNSLVIGVNGTAGGTVLLSNASNSYGGGTTISSGILKPSAEGNLGALTGSLTLSGGTLQMGASGFTFGATHAITLTSGTSSTIDTNSFSLNLAQNIGGAGNLIKAGTGTLSLTSVLNSYTGATTINAGILQFSALTGIGGTGANVAVNSSGTLAAAFALDQNTINRIVSGSAGVVALAADSSNNLDFSSAGASLTAASLGATGAYTYSGTLTPNGTNYRLGGGGGTLTVSSNLSGANNLIAGVNSTAASAVLLNGTNTYTGTTTVNTSTTLRAGTASAYGNNSAVTVNSGGILDLNGNSNTLGSLAGAGAVTLGGATLTTGGNNTSTTLSGAINGTAAGGSIVKNGTGTWILSGTNRYTGTTTVNAGILQFNSANAVGGGATGNTGANVLVNYGGTVSFATAITQTLLNRFDPASTGVIALATASGNALDFSAAGAKLPSASLGATGNYTYSGALTPNASIFRLGGGGNNTLTVSSVLSGGGNSLVVDSNGTTAGTVALTGTNTYGGTTTVNTGTLQITAESNLGATPSAFTANSLTLSGGTLQIGGTGNTTSLSANRGITLSSGKTSVIDTQTNTLLVAGTVTGGGNLTKIGTGALTLSGTNNYTGVTTVSAGSLILTGGAPSSAITVASGARLNAGGSIGALTAMAGSTIGLLNSSGTGLGAVTGTSLLLDNGSTLEFDLGANQASDTINLAGALDYHYNAASSSSTVSFTFDMPNVDVTAGSTFTLITFNSTDANSFTDVSKFSAAPRGNALSLNGHFVFNAPQSGQPGSIQYVLTSYTATPEPGGLILFLFGGGISAALGLRRRRRVRHGVHPFAPEACEEAGGRRAVPGRSYPRSARPDVQS